MSATSLRKTDFGQSHDATVIVDFVLQMTFPELEQRRTLMQEVLDRTQELHKEQMISSPIHHAWAAAQADLAYIKHSIELLEQAMMFAPKSHDAQRGIVVTSMEAARG